MAQNNMEIQPKTIEVFENDIRTLKDAALLPAKEENENNSNVGIDITDRIIDNANTYFLVKILSPEITKNENKKRTHKDSLIDIIKIFLIAQFAILFMLLLGVLTMIFVFHGLGNELDLAYIKEIIRFISLYITSVVVEIVAMLKYIVENVFDTSITGLVEFYKDASAQNTKSNTKQKEQES